jgi:uncharacterized protein YlxW (UPF0749 family)
MNNFLSWRTYFVFIITGVFIGLLMTAQFRSSIPSSSYLSDRLQAQKELIKSFIDDQGLLKSKIVTLRDKINEQQQKIKASSQSNNLETLATLKKDMGLETVKGPGVEVVLNDGVFVNRESTDNIDQSLIHASDLRDLVNLLRTAKAEAISINDQRVIASTPITSVGNTILVNNFHLLPPFNVSAVGDSEIILQRLNEAGVLPDLTKRAQELKVQFSFRGKEGLSAPVYNGNLTTDYIAKAQ